MKQSELFSTHSRSHACPERHHDHENRECGADNQGLSFLEASSLISLLRQAPNTEDCDNLNAEHLALEELAVYLTEQSRDDVNSENGSRNTHFALRDVFSMLVRRRLMTRDYTAAPAREHAASPRCVLRVLQCVRLFLRERAFVSELFTIEGAVQTLSQQYKQYASIYSREPPETKGANYMFRTEILSEIASIFKKLASEWAACPSQLLIDYDVHQTALSLISTRDASILASVLVTLNAICLQTEKCAELVVCHSSVYYVLLIMCEYDAPFNHIAGKLLQMMSKTTEGKNELRRLGSVSVLMSLIRRSSDQAILESSLRILGCLLSDTLAVEEFRDLGGVPILLALLIPNSTARISDELRFQQPAVTCLVCSALTKLATDDVGSRQIQDFNGFYLLGKLLTDTHDFSMEERSSRPICEISAHAFRVLRFLFSTAHNRKTFQHLFQAEMFGAFIDIGHYMQDIRMYRHLAHAWLSMPSSLVKITLSSLEDINADRRGTGPKPLRVIHGYVVDELLGTGAFASVYRVHKEKDCLNTVFAMKELDTGIDRDTFGESLKQVTASVGRVAMEIEILSKLEHPNIVNYHESFMENNQLYIIMELVEGQNLFDYINSTADKNRVLCEKLIWEIFIQIVLALNYIHVEKGVVHRDLSPNNILLEHGTKRVKLADFGLAKAHKCNQTNSRRNQENMQSAVGTMPFSCPEIIIHASYGEKADIWSLGCVLYFMLALRPPFEASNPLALASAIVEGRYEPLDAFTKRLPRPNNQIDDIIRVYDSRTTQRWSITQRSSPLRNDDNPGRYSPALVGLVRRLLVTNPDKRPSILEVAAACAPYLMRSLDHLQRAHTRLQSDYNHDKANGLMPSVGKIDLQKHEAILHLRSASSIKPEEYRRLMKNVHDDTMVVSAANKHDLTFKTKGKENSKIPARWSSVAPAAQNDKKFKVASDCFRPIPNPLSEILAVIHKIIFIDQLPPDLGRDPRRIAVHRFKRHLFAAHQTAVNIKVETAQLLAGSHDFIKLNIPTASQEPGDKCFGKDLMQNVTYNSLGRSIEDLLVLHGFYASHQQKATVGFM